MGFLCVMLSVKVRGGGTNSVSASINIELRAVVTKTTVSEVYVLFFLKKTGNIYWYY